jgi:hypothetical protein
MSNASGSDHIAEKPVVANTDLERQQTVTEPPLEESPAPKSLGAGVSRPLQKHRELLTQDILDRAANWCLRHDPHDSVSEFDGMERRHDNKRLRCQLLLCRGI